MSERIRSLTRNRDAISEYLDAVLADDGVQAPAADAPPAERPRT